MNQATGGAPLGNQNAAKAKRWQKALERALARASSSDVDAGLDKVADRVVKAATEETGPDAREAWKEIGDRIDGKAAQEITGKDGGPLVVIQATQHDEKL